MSTSVVWPGREGVQIEDREVRPAGPGELKVRVEASGLCGTDLHIASGEYPFARPGVTIGHEFAGEVVEIGTDVVGPGEESRISLSLIQNKELWLAGTFRYANTYPAAIELAAAGKVDLDAIVTSYYGLEDTKEALQASRKDPPANVKPMVIPNSRS